MTALVALFFCLGFTTLCILHTVNAAEQPISNHSSSNANIEVCTSKGSNGIGSCHSSYGGDRTIPSDAIPSAAETIISSSNIEDEGTTTNPKEDFAIPLPDPSVVGYPVSRYTTDRREIDKVETVREEHLGGANPLGVSPGEWKARTELAAAYRALYLLGLERSTLGSDQAAQCLMMRLEEDDGSNGNNSTTITFLMADWGVWFEEVTASNLLKFTVDGAMIPSNDNDDPDGPDESRYRTNSGCVPVAKAIFEARPDVRLVVHIHPYACMAVGGTRWGLLPLSQAAFFLWGQVSREDYDFTYESSFEDTLAVGFVHGERAMLLNHHGMYAVGRDAAEALFVATHLTQACEVQVRTLSMVGGDLSKVLLPPGEDLSRQYKDMMDSTDYSYDGSREWPGILRKVRRQAPDFNT